MRAQLLAQLRAHSQEEEAILRGEGIRQDTYTNQAEFHIEISHMLHRGQTFAIRQHTRFAPFPRHSHEFVEMTYMCQGQTVHHMEHGETVTLRAGELLILSQNTSHRIDRAEQDDLAVNFFILPQFFDTAFDLIGSDNVLSRFLLGSLTEHSEIPYLYLQVSDLLPIQNLIENLVWSLVADQPNDRRINEHTMGLLFLQLLNYTDRMRLGEAPRQGNAMLLAALREIETRYPTANLGAIAQEFHVSCAYLSGLIKAHTGATFKQLLQQKRLEKAAALLLRSQLSAEEIMTAVGYANSSYFYRKFKERYGKTPFEFRHTAGEASTSILVK